MSSRINVDPAVCHGQACIRGTRIPVAFVVGRLASGDTAEDLLVDYPHITMDDIDACLQYAASLQAEMPTPHYSYRMARDTGFAPHVERGACSLCGCKETTIERWATPGSWVVGIGGEGTRQPDRLIYAMQVEETPQVAEFRRSHPDWAAYLDREHPPEARVLLSTRFWYFGDRAPDLPPRLAVLNHPVQGCKSLTDEQVDLLRDWLQAGWKPGKHGRPNNPERKGGAC